MLINSKIIGDIVFVVAEIGLNHNGDFEVAKKLIKHASCAEADAVTIQLIEPDSLSNDSNVIDFLKKVYFSNEQINELSNYAKQNNIIFGTAILDVLSLKRSIECGSSFVKTVSGDITNYQLLQEIGKANIPYLMSTGASNLNEIECALHEVNNKNNIVLVHTTTQQQSPLSSLNMKAIQLMKDKFGLPVGYCDHTNEELAIPLAVAAGAVVVEKYIINDKSLQIADYKVSVEPLEFITLVQKIRSIELALGKSIKNRNEYEEDHILKIRRSAVAKYDILDGETLTIDKIEFKRPGNGLNFKTVQFLLNKVVKVGFKKGELITKSKLL